MGEGNARTGRLKLGLQIAAACVVVLIGAFAVGSAVAGPFFWYSCSLDGLEAQGASQASILVSSDGTRLGLLGTSGARQPIALRRIRPVMRKAIIDTEDRRFYSNNGIDYIGIMRALKSDVSAGGSRRAGRRSSSSSSATSTSLPSSRSAGSSPKPASRFSSTSNGARTASSPPTSTTSTSASRRTGSRPPPTRTSGCTRRTSRSSRRRCWRGCRRRRRRTTRSTGPTPRRHAGRRSYGRCSRRETYPRPVTDELSKAHSGCIRDRRPGSRARRT